MRGAVARDAAPQCRVGQGLRDVADIADADVGARCDDLVDTVEDVRAKGRLLEGTVLSRALQLYLNNEIVVINGKVVFKPGMRTLLREFGSRA